MANPATYITEHLDKWSSAIKAKSSAGRGGGKKQEFYGIKKLRELILGLAVRGLLVSQDPDEEPAVSQLERIATAQIKNGRSKKQSRSITSSSLSEIDSKSLPAGWANTTLESLVTILNGRAYKDSELLDAGTPVLRVGNLFTSSHWYYSDLDLGDDKYCESGDLIYAWSASFGPFIWNGPRAIYHYHIWKLLPHREEDISKNFLFWFLQEKTQEIKSAGRGLAMLHMTKGKMEKLAVRLPPLAEQNRIAAKVDELMALCDQLEQQQEDGERTHGALVETLLGALTAASEGIAFAEAWQRIASHFDSLFTTESSIDQLKQTILQVAVMGKLVEQDRDDKPVKGLTVGDHIEFQNGYAFKGEWFKDSGVRLCRNVNVSHGILDWGESKFVNEEVAKEFERFALCEDDIVLSLDRPLITTGLKVARIRKGDLPCLLLQRVAKPVPKHDKIDLSYFYMWLHSPAFVNSIDPGRSNGVPHISTKQVQALPLILPPPFAQCSIVAKVDELMTLCERLKARLQSAQATQLHLADTLVEAAIH